MTNAHRLAVVHSQLSEDNPVGQCVANSHNWLMKNTGFPPTLNLLLQFPNCPIRTRAQSDSSPVSGQKTLVQIREGDSPDCSSLSPKPGDFREKEGQGCFLLHARQ